MGSLNLRAPLASREPPAAIHLPEERLSELVFKFKTVGGNYSALTSYPALLRPRAGHTYEATVTYDAGFHTRWGARSSADPCPIATVFEPQLVNKALR